MEREPHPLATQEPAGMGGLRLRKQRDGAREQQPEIDLDQGASAQHSCRSRERASIAAPFLSESSRREGEAR